MRELKHAKMSKNNGPDLVAHAAFDQQLRDRLADHAEEHFFMRGAILNSVDRHVDPFSPRVRECDAGEPDAPEFVAGEITSTQVRAGEVRSAQVRELQT